VADWVTISSLATAGGTLALALATFASTRSANQATRISELALRQQLRPVLMQSQADDPELKIMFAEQHWVRVPGGGAVVEHEDGVVYMSLSLRNVGTGIGVLLGWNVIPEFSPAVGARDPVPPSQFHVQLRDLWIPAGGVGLWQGALRDESDELHGRMRQVAEQRTAFMLDLLYADHVGAQRAISRFSVVPAQEDRWISSVTRHWHVDGDTPLRDAPTL
jgi:hypothetical protein